jgi:hypothetical protein
VRGDDVIGMGVPEILILLGIIALVVLVLLPGGGSTYDVADETIVRGISWETADQVLFRELSNARGLTLVEAHAGSYTLERSSRPGWVYVAALLVFPLGLVFLLIKQEHRIQVSLTAHEGGCRLRIVGRARRRDIDQVAASIGRVLPVPTEFTH